MQFKHSAYNILFNVAGQSVTGANSHLIVTLFIIILVEEMWLLAYTINFAVTLVSFSFSSFGSNPYSPRTVPDY